MAAETSSSEPTAQSTSSSSASPSSTTFPPFIPTIPAVPKQVSELLSGWSGIPRGEDQVAHVVRVRDAAYARVQYPCLGRFRFLALDLAAHPAYGPHVLAPLLEEDGAGAGAGGEPLFLDLGSCLGQDLRKLAHDGAPARRLWASDVVPELIEAGFELFRDAGKMPRDHFLCPADVFSDAPDDKLKILDDKVTILHITAVFHLFSLEKQKQIADRCLRLLRKDTGKPVLILGGQAGKREGGVAVKDYAGPGSKDVFRHNVETWRDMWEEVVLKDEWKERVRTLDVKSALFKRGFSVAEEKVFFLPLTDNDTELLWHMFEVWVTFH